MPEKEKERMSFIRYSTKIPGQKTTSRIYAWADIDGGIKICGRDANGEQKGEILVSYPEMYYMCVNFLSRIKRAAKNKKTTQLNIVKNNHRGFWKIWDKEWEQSIKILKLPLKLPKISLNIKPYKKG